MVGACFPVFLLSPPPGRSAAGHWPLAGRGRPGRGCGRPDEATAGCVLAVAGHRPWIGGYVLAMAGHRPWILGCMSLTLDLPDIGCSRAQWDLRSSFESRLSVQSAEGCLEWPDRSATLAYEMCWTSDCRKDPRPCAADSRRLCPFSCAGLVPAPLTSACVLLPVHREVAFATCCLCCVLPLGVTRWLVSACGVASCCRLHEPAPPRPPRSCYWLRMLLML